MEAQVAACRIGADRFDELIARYGIETVTRAGEDLMDYSERLLRQEIEKLPDGSYEAEGFIDGFQDDPNPANRDLRMQATRDRRGLRHPRRPRRHLAADRPAAEHAVRGHGGHRRLPHDPLDPARQRPPREHPANSGLFRPIRITAPEGCLANPRFPAPTIARFCPGNIVADTVMRALAPLVPDNVSAGVGNLKVVAYSGLSGGGQHWVYMDIQEGSYGGRPGKDGLDAVDTLYANTRNNPIEDIESHYPLRVTRYELNVDTGGAGRWRGGLGTVREIEFLEAGGMSLEGDGSVHAPPGLFGGADGTPGRVEINRHGRDGVEVPSKFPVSRHPGRRPAVPGRPVRRRLRVTGRARSGGHPGRHRGRGALSRAGAATLRPRRVAVRIGVDVGGTNTDAVLVDGRDVLAEAKTPTTPDVTEGISSAIRALVASSGIGVSGVQAVMIGTTHFTNAVVEARRLAPTAAIRLGLPATEALPPHGRLADRAPRGDLGATSASATAATSSTGAGSRRSTRRS